MAHRCKTLIEQHLKKLIIPPKYTDTGRPEFPEGRYRRWETQDLAIELTDGRLITDSYDMLLNPDFDLTLDVRSEDFLVIISVDYGRLEIPWQEVIDVKISGNNFVW